MVLEGVLVLLGELREVSVFKHCFWIELTETIIEGPLDTVVRLLRLLEVHLGNSDGVVLQCESVKLGLLVTDAQELELAEPEFGLVVVLEDFHNFLHLLHHRQFFSGFHCKLVMRITVLGHRLGVEESGRLSVGAFPLQVSLVDGAYQLLRPHHLLVHHLLDICKLAILRFLIGLELLDSLVLKALVRCSV